MRTFKKMFLLASCFMLVFNFTSCKKPAGEGGTSTIKGKVMTEDWNNAFTIKNGEYAGYDVDVYIVYGDNIGYSDRTRTDYNGEYQFKYLTKGKYKIYVYSKDKTLMSASGDISIVKEVEVKAKKETVSVDLITIYD